MIIMSEGIKQGWYVTEVLCSATNEWQCEFYQMATECRDTADIGDGLVGTNCTAVEHYIPTFSVGGGTWQWEQASGLYGMTSGNQEASPKSSRAAGTKSLSPQGWSSASKWLRI